MFAFCGRYGDMDKMWPRMQEFRDAGNSAGLFREYLWQLEQLMSAGYFVSSQNNGGAELPISAEEMETLLCLGDMPAVQESISTAIVLGSSREVGAAAPKDGGEAEKPGQTG